MMSALAETVFMPAATRDRVRERASRQVLAAAAVIGVGGDLLIGSGPGIGVSLLFLLVAREAQLLDARRPAGPVGAPLRWFVVVLFGAALTFAWRESDPLRLAALGSSVVAAALLAQAWREGESWSLWRLDPAALIVAVRRAIASALFSGPLLVVRDGALRSESRGTVRRGARTATRAALVSVPVLLLFVPLLTAADPIFQRMVARVFDFDLSPMWRHLAIAGTLTWLGAGYLRGGLLAEPATVSRAQATGILPHGVRASDVLVPLALLDALFILFTAVQARAAIGGAAYVRAAAGMSLADYARQGFFQLVVAAGLTLAGLLLADALAPEDSRTRRALRALSGAALALVGTLVAAAAWRMVLYLDAFGLTELRLYASVAMAWIAASAAWMALTVLRGRRERFAGGALVLAWVAQMALMVANPDALIVRANVERLARGASFDAQYVGWLSDDAVPPLARALAAMPAHERCVLGYRLVARATERDEQAADWRRWTVGRMRADAALGAAGIVADPASRTRGAQCDVAVSPATGGAARRR